MIKKSLEGFLKLNLSQKVEKLFPKGNQDFKRFIEHPDISEKMKHNGLDDIMNEFLDPYPSGIPYSDLLHWMMYRLGLEALYRKDFAKYDFSQYDAFDDDFFQEACARGAVYQIT